jgi:hypothetical protein
VSGWGARGISGGAGGVGDALVGFVFSGGDFGANGGWVTSAIYPASWWGRASSGKLGCGSFLVFPNLP